MGILAHKEIEKSVQMKDKFVKLCDIPKNLFSEQFCPGCTAVLLLLTAWVNFEICRYSSATVRFLPLICQQALVLFCKVTNIWSVHIQSTLYFSFTLCFWLLWLLQAGKYCAVGRAVFQLPEFLHSLNGKKQTFWGSQHLISIPLSYSHCCICKGCRVQPLRPKEQRHHSAGRAASLPHHSPTTERLAGARSLTDTGFTSWTKLPVDALSACWMSPLGRRLPFQCWQWGSAVPCPCSSTLHVHKCILWALQSCHSWALGWLEALPQQCSRVVCSSATQVIRRHCV